MAVTGFLLHGVCCKPGFCSAADSARAKGSITNSVKRFGLCFSSLASQQELLKWHRFFLYFVVEYQIFLEVRSVFELRTSLTCVLKSLRTTTLKFAACMSFNFKSFLISRSSFSLQSYTWTTFNFIPPSATLDLFYLFIGFNHLCSLWSALKAACALVRELITSPRSYLQSFSVTMGSGKINNSQNKSDSSKPH